MFRLWQVRLGFSRAEVSQEDGRPWPDRPESKRGRRKRTRGSRLTMMKDMLWRPVERISGLALAGVYAQSQLEHMKGGAQQPETKSPEGRLGR